MNNGVLLPRAVSQILVLIALGIFSGCASHQTPFQKSVNGGYGYAVLTAIPLPIATPSASLNFSVKTNLGPGATEKYSIVYGTRAVAEECLAQGYAFFDVGVVDAHHFDGYCYKTSDHPALAVEFTEIGLDARPQQFIVNALNGKSKTNLQTGDEIIEVGGRAPNNVAAVKAAVFRADSDGQKKITLKVRRAGIVKTITEPIALFKNSSMGSMQLDLIRSRTD